MEMLGDYAILKQIGQGPFSKVYLAEHRFIKKQFALKVLSKEISKSFSFAEKWTRSAQRLIELEHPSIVKIHNVSYADERCFIVMDPIVDATGETMNLSRFLELKGKRLSEGEIEGFLLQVASALDYIHQLVAEPNTYLYHGALKPTNILLGRNDKGINLYLSDAGLSSIIGNDRLLFKALELFSSSLAATIENLEGQKEYQLLSSHVQSYAFLSPEQKAFPASHIPDARADIYAFGVLTYFLTTKEFPEGCFDFPSKIMPEYKLHWDLLIRECLHKDPAKRPLHLVKKMEELLYNENTPIEVVPWKEVEKKVEDALQMSFEFSQKSLEESKSSSVVEEAPSLFSLQGGKPSPKPILKPQEIHRPTYDPDPATVFQKDLSVSRYQPTKVEVKEVDPLLTDMVVIPEGTYSRGSKQGARDEMPRHPVFLKSFALDIHPITNEQFVRFLQAMGGEKDSNNNDIIRLRDSRIKRSGGKLLIESGYNRHPVVGVTWYGAVAYAKWVGKRLPTEAEWEIASYGGMENSCYPAGEDIERSQANFFSSDTTAVLSYPPNGYGLYDVAGNVYEWCQDWYAYNYYETSSQEPENPQGPPQGVYRVLRGGCWKSLKEDLRCSHRHRNNPGAVNGTYGFRCAADVS